MTELGQPPAPWELERDQKNIANAADRINRTFEAVKIFLQAAEHGRNIQKISRIIENPLNEELVYRSLLELYGSVYALFQKVKQKAGSKARLSEAKIGGRPAKEILDDAINRIIFLYERDILLSPIRPDLENRKSEYGPAMYSDQVKRCGRNLITSIENQTNELLPAAYQICQKFSGITPQLVGKDDRKKGERDKYEEVWLIYQAEQIVKDRIKQIGSFGKDKQLQLGKLISDFSGLRVACQEKIDSLEFTKDKNERELKKIEGNEQTTQHLELEAGIKKAQVRAAKIKSGLGRLLEIEKLLKTLKNLIEKFPGIADSIEFYMESAYQAKSVRRFLDEITQEMMSVFGHRNIEAFEVISTLEYKLKANSLMFDGAGYYQAACYMEKDIIERFTRILKEKQGGDVGPKVTATLEKVGMTAVIHQLHACMNRIKKQNNRMHLTMMSFAKRVSEYNDKTPSELRERDKNELISDLQSLLKLVESEMRYSVTPNYERSQEIYQDFSERIMQDKHVGEQVIRCFFDLARRGKQTGMKKEELQNFQRFKLYSKMKPHPGMQAYFIKALKKFVKGEKCDQILPQQIANNFVSEMELLTERMAAKYKDKIPYSKNEMAVKALSESITPMEIESFARIVPSMPRNELKLVNFPGKIFVSIAEKHKDYLRSQAQRQFVLLNPGQEPQSENEIRFKELSAMELVKKAYGVFNNYMEPLSAVIKAEKSKELDFVEREKSKWRKELEQIIFELQEQVNFAVEESEPETTDLRKYSTEEVELMQRHIHPDQIDRLEQIFSVKHTVDLNSRLFELEDLIGGVAQGFFKLLELDESLKAEYEEIQAEKRRLHLGGKTENLEKKLEQIERFRWQKKIEDLLLFWEFGISQAMPKSDQKLWKEVKARVYSDKELQTMAINIDPEQLDRIKRNIAAIREHAKGKQGQILFDRGSQALTVAQSCFDLLEKDEGMMVPSERAGRQRIAKFKSDGAFKKEVDKILSHTFKSAVPSSAKIPQRGPTKEKPPKTSPPDQINKLIAAFRNKMFGKKAPEDLPKIESKKLSAYAQALTAGQFQNVSWLAKDRIHVKEVMPEERALVVIALNSLNLAKGNKIPQAEDIMEMEAEAQWLRKRYQTIAGK